MRAYFRDKFPEDLDKLCALLYPHLEAVPRYHCLYLKSGDWEIVSKKSQDDYTGRSDKFKLINKTISRTRHIEFDIHNSYGRPVLKTVVNDGYSELELADIVSIIETFNKG